MKDYEKLVSHDSIGREDKRVTAPAADGRTPGDYVADGRHFQADGVEPGYFNPFTGEVQVRRDRGVPRPFGRTPQRPGPARPSSVTGKVLRGRK